MKRHVYSLDRYTKFILTVIAISLVYICVKPYIEPATLEAQYNRTVDVNIKEIAGYSVMTPLLSLPVENSELNSCWNCPVFGEPWFPLP